MGEHRELPRGARAAVAERTDHACVVPVLGTLGAGRDGGGAGEGNGMDASIARIDCMLE